MTRNRVITMLRRSLIGISFSILSALCAQVPQLINFQGRVAVDGVNFNGTGLFKFALVNGDGGATLWSNDGTGTDGGEPTNAVAIPVSQGLYAVLLGDTTLTNMTPISAAVFTNIDVRLRIWFNDGTNGFQQLSPDQRIAAVGYAMMAANVADGMITSVKLAEGAVTSGKLAINAVTATNIAPHSIGLAQLATNAAADSLRDSGGLVVSDQSNATNLVKAGYVRVGQVTTDVDNWQIVGNASPAARSYHAAVWTGSEMIIWGGYSTPGRLAANTGARFNPVTGIWTPVTMNGAPSPRLTHTAIWTGREMIIWGGAVSIDNPFQTGGRYDPLADRWQPTSTANASTSRYNHTAVWTGTEMIVWGGQTTNGVSLGTGGRYNPSTDTWATTAVSDLAPPRFSHTAVWTGNEMILWGGFAAGTNGVHAEFSNTGARYSPASDSWLATPVNSDVLGRQGHAAIWTGSEMIIWGGVSGFSEFLGTGARYNPMTDSWMLVSNVNAPQPRYQSTAVWTGNEMIIWGGLPSYVPTNTGGRYSPATDSWTAVSINNAPGIRTAHTAVWSGSEMIVWGGATNVQRGGLDTGGRYNPSTDSWMPTTVTPGGRIGHTAVWTGSEMIVWGGTNSLYNFSNVLLRSLGTGGRFNPVTATWTPVSTDNAPTPRQYHTAVWTGTEMIVWGGLGYLQVTNLFLQPNVTVLNTGGRYNPATDKWQQTEPAGAPQARRDHTAVWTGDGMIIWGGSTTNLPFYPSMISLSTGGRYDPLLNTWTTMTSAGAPGARANHVALWTGKEMIVWGGFGPVTNNLLRLLNTGGRYDPARNIWSNLSTTGAPSVDGLPAAIWTGAEMIVWLGFPFVDPHIPGGGRYRPDSDSWFSISRSNAPGLGRTLAWTGKEMIVWDGRRIGRYSPATDTWLLRQLPGSPPDATGPTAVWTGTSMLLFGGSQPGNLGTVYPGDVYAYSLTRPMYLYQKP